MNRLTTLFFIPILLSTLFLFNGSAAFAQTIKIADTISGSVEQLDTVELLIDEVVITGTRISKKIIDIPYSVVRLNYVDYKYDKKLGIDEVLSSVPGMFMQSRYGNHDVRVSIRGFGSKSNSGIRGVRILLDDIPESEPDGQTRIEAIDFQSVGRIEIAKGNLSSMYTNAPGGVVNFINDIDFMRTHGVQFNQFGSFGLQRNGVKVGLRTEDYGLLTTYSNHHFEGYRAHNNEQWNILNTVLEARPSDHSKLKLLLYYADGQIKLPGSLTREEYDEDPFQADQRAIDRDSKRLSTKGRLGIRYNTSFGRKLQNVFELTAYGTIKYFERTAKEYRIINRYGLGVRANYLNKTKILERTNEFSVGADLLFQPARTEYYDNINGKKGDQLFQLYNEKIYNNGFYLSNNYEILKQRLFVLVTGRYDRINFKLQEETLPSRADSRTFNAFMPKLAFNYKLTPEISVYTSYGLSFDSPAKNELESFDPAKLYNSQLKAQETRSFEMGIKGNLIRRQAAYFKRLLFELTLFNMNIENEVVPFEVFSEVYFRNAAKTSRRGLEAGTRIEIVKALNLTLSYTFSDFSYSNYKALAIEIDTAGNLSESEQDFSGHIVPSVPRNNLFVALSYSYPIYQKVHVFAKLGYTGISGLWVDDANSDKTDGYRLINSQLGFDMVFGKFNLLLSGGVHNMLDEAYVGFTNTNSAERRFYEAGAPRNYFVSLNIGYRF